MGVYSKESAYVPDIKRNSFDMSFQNNMTMDFGKIYPVACIEALPGDTVVIDEAHGLRGMPLKFPIQTKCRIDLHAFYVRSRNLWRGWMDFIASNNGDDVPPFLSSSNMPITTGSLSDYLGVPTTTVYHGEVSSADNVARFDDVPTSLPNLYAVMQPIYTAYGPHKFQFVTLTDDGEVPMSSPLPNFASVKAALLDIDGLNLSSNRLVVDFNDFEFGSAYDDFVYFSLVVDAGAGHVFSPSPVGNSDTTNMTFDLSSLDEQSKLSGKYYLFFFGFLKDISSSDFIDAVNNIYGGTLSFYSTTSPSLIDSNFTASNYPVKLSALPFRAYESIYNSFYRDQRNNPYIIDGKQCPNQYIPTTDGGADDNVYELRSRNWEQDQFTTAMTSPQAGVAPLVGITSTGKASFQSEDGTIYTAQLQTADDGDTVTGVTYNSNLPNDVARALVNVASSGISINDFRAVNSLQRWMETKLRQGLKYRDQIKGHFGVDVSYSELDMPEFLGGYSQILDINQVNQTAPVGDDPLGSYAGQVSSVGSLKHKIQHYCDEHGFIIVLASIVPVPVYTQCLPKMFTKTSVLDYFFPEFGHLGYQPIPYKEVCPLQTQVVGSPVNLNSTFGYQRAWYDYLSRLDEAHGEFRTSLRDFLLMRTFEGVPALNEDFLLVDSNSLNQVFATDDYDKFLGQFHFDILMKRPIPRYGIPRLE